MSQSSRVATFANDDDPAIDSARQVVILFPVHDLGDGDEDVKIVGVYSDEDSADAAIVRKRDTPGFGEHPEGFQKSTYTLDRDAWSEGFITEWTE